PMALLQLLREASEGAAKHIRNRIVQCNPGPDKYFILGLPPGAPIDCESRTLRWRPVLQIWEDLQHGGVLPRESPSFLWNSFLQHTDTHPGNHILGGHAADLQAGSDASEDKIEAAGGTELFVGGIGPDIAFTELGTSLASRTRVEDTILASARFFDGDLSKMPRWPWHGRCHRCERDYKAPKAFALYNTIEEGVNHMWTVSTFQDHPRTMFVCDEDAILKLKVKAVK
uniref:Uncharacterized protein n=1 Tax=Myotis lucifugus TaxID=59463 RepID=G1Q9L4_MYOLU